MLFAFWSPRAGAGNALDDGVAAAAGGFIRTPGGVRCESGLAMLGGGDEESVAAFAVGVTDGVG